VNQQPIIVKYGKLQERHQKLLEVLEATNDRNNALVNLINDKIKPFLESVMHDEHYGCNSGDCPHEKATECNTAYIALLKERAAEAKALIGTKKEEGKEETPS